MHSSSIDSGAACYIPFRAAAPFWGQNNFTRDAAGWFAPQASQHLHRELHRSFRPAAYTVMGAWYHTIHQVSCVLVPTVFTAHNTLKSWVSQGAAKAIDWPRPAQYNLVRNTIWMRVLDTVLTTHQHKGTSRALWPRGKRRYPYVCFRFQTAGLVALLVWHGMKSARLSGRRCLLGQEKQAHFMFFVRDTWPIPRSRRLRKRP